MVRNFGGDESIFLVYQATEAAQMGQVKECAPGILLTCKHRGCVCRLE